MGLFNYVLFGLARFALKPVVPIGALYSGANAQGEKLEDGFSYVFDPQNYADDLSKVSSFLGKTYDFAVDKINGVQADVGSLILEANKVGDVNMLDIIGNYVENPYSAIGAVGTVVGLGIVADQLMKIGQYGSKDTLDDRIRKSTVGKVKKSLSKTPKKRVEPTL